MSTFQAISQIKCPQCKKDFPSSHYDLTKQVGQCPHCKVLIQSVGSFGSSHLPAKEEILKTPATNINFQLLPSGGFKAVRKWENKSKYFLTVFSLFWNSITLSIFGSLIMKGAFAQAPFMLLHVAVGLITAYLALAFWLNKTYITLQNGILEVKNGPLPFGRNVRMNGSDITQVLIKDYVAYSQNKRPVHALMLEAQLANGKKQDLIKGIYNYPEAVQLERMIEDHLRIKDESSRDRVSTF